MTSERAQWPSEDELAFLKPSYSFFFEIFDEVNTDDFWTKDSYYRFSRLRDAVLIYSELLEYEPIKRIIEVIRRVRPPIEAELRFASLLARGREHRNQHAAVHSLPAGW